ncbi:NF038122 family metalloprotease [Thalassomonas actiniarum]|uniref:PEP-CTERM sorting domain-containing protein n=1 Tax=Thalassomonas actiniarum TaxID=485447 RepID=A0AAE9YVS5_9GAMM|nr:NF038122 family metalloprotease [Thalassomonas actiniarum]WDE02171.1 PEP-CTERM sorting domain-containing protein [Thalassomonas actiniarum]
MYINKVSAIAAIVLAASVNISTAFATTIELTYNDSDFADAQGQLALAGFRQAADFWSSTFVDDVTINLDIGFAALAPNVIGSTGSNRAVFLYDDIIQGMTNDATSAADASAVNNLVCDDQSVGVCAISFLDQEADSASPGLDNDGSADNYALALTQANAKALGFSANSWGTAFLDSDASITFSNAFAFDFDPSDGIDSDKMDFVGVAIHEIGHALGFTSGVDTYDYWYNNQTSPLDLDDYAIINTLDLFRYSDESLAAGDGVLDFRPGADSYFSIDGGQTSLARFSTGSFGGDGRQASHWKDHLGLGTMDPTTGFGEYQQVSSLDILAFDVMGWDLASTSQVPEPASVALFGLAGVGLLFGRRRNCR